MYPYSSPLNISNYAVSILSAKLVDMLRVEDVALIRGTWRALLDQPVVELQRRSIVVLESNDTKVIRHFTTNAKLFKEKYRAFRVTEKDEDEAISSDNYDNCYVLGPNGSM